MHMLMRAAGSIGGIGGPSGLSADSQDLGPGSGISGPGSAQPVSQGKVERIPGKVGRPKLTFKEKVRGEHFNLLIFNVCISLSLNDVY